MGKRKYPLNRNPYKMLPPELRPRYKKSGELRMMARAYREGWVHGVCEERIGEWYRDVSEALDGPRTVRIKITACKVFLATQKYESKRILSYMKLRQMLLPMKLELLSVCRDGEGGCRRKQFESLWGKVLERYVQTADPVEYPFLAPP